MSARIVQTPGGWLVVCDSHERRWETYAERRPAAERLAREHNNRKHKEQ